MDYTDRAAAARTAFIDALGGPDAAVAGTTAGALVDALEHAATTELMGNARCRDRDVNRYRFWTAAAEALQR